MTIDELRGWVVGGLGQVGAPLTSQNAATTLAWSVVLEALVARVTDQGVTLNAVFGREWQDQQRMVSKWQAADDRRLHEPREIIVDFSAFESGFRRNVRFTAESEMYGQHSTGFEGDYAWDFYKLLVVPSPLRLFLCRVNGDSQRRDQLESTLSDLFARHAERYVAEEDELGVVILPTARGRQDDIRLLVSGSVPGKLTGARVDQPEYISVPAVGAGGGTDANAATLGGTDDSAPFSNGWFLGEFVACCQCGRFWQHAGTTPQPRCPNCGCDWRAKDGLRHCKEAMWALWLAGFNEVGDPPQSGFLPRLAWEILCRLRLDMVQQTAQSGLPPTMW